MVDEQFRRAQNEKSIPFADWLRTAAAIMILLCHFCSQRGGPLFNAAAQILNIGVPLFFILSGYLFGRKGIRPPYRKWFLRRLERLWLPYWLFLAVLAAIYLLKGLNIWTLDWLLLLFGLQGSVVGVWGAEQTWFITALMICYGATPIISIATAKLDKKHISWFLAGLSILPLLLHLMKPVAIGTLLAPVCLSAVAYFIGSRTLNVKVTGWGARWAVVTIIVSFGLRFILRIFFDGTVFYSGIVATYTHYAAALAIFCLFAWFFSDRRPVRIVAFIGNISFEMYLYHYMLTVGPISLFGVTGYWSINCILAFGVTLTIAAVMHHIGKRFERRIFKARVREKYDTKSNSLLLVWPWRKA